MVSVSATGVRVATNFTIFAVVYGKFWVNIL